MHGPRLILEKLKTERESVSAKALLEIVVPPLAAAKRASWVEQHGLLSWLQNERMAKQVTLYGSAYERGSVFVHALLVPASKIDFGNEQAFISWSGNPFDHPSCGLVYGGGRPPRIELTPPSMSHEEFYPDAKRVIYGRSFEARNANQIYYELSHELSLAHGLHWLEERDAWCRLDDAGDVVDVARIERVGRSTGGRGSAVAITIDREVLELHMAATNTCLVQMFDSTCTASDFDGWKTWNDNVFKDLSNGLILKYRAESPTGSFFRGSQVIRPQLSAEELGAALFAAGRAPKKYGTFITQDFKNRRLAEVSCAPDALASYFDKGSPLPFQTSPVFFRPEVLDKYKSNPDKYRLSDRGITCRNSWSLQTYDVNDAGQVHTYITYLGNLPYSEQLYWKSFNEEPKAPISRRAIQTDFKGEYDDEPDGLRELRRALEHVSESRAPWFTLREPSLLDQLHYPLTTSSKTWGDTLTTLAKCVVEGLNKGYFVSEAKLRGSSGEASWGSVKWVREFLHVLGVDGDRVSEVVDPLVNVQMLRTKLDAHAGGGEAALIRRELLKKFRQPRSHIHALAMQLAASMEAIESIVATSSPTRLE